MCSHYFFPLAALSVWCRSGSAGAYVVPGTRIVELSKIDPSKVDFRVPELVLSSLRADQAIRVIVDALPDRTFDGKIFVIDPIVDENGRAVRLRARIPNPDRALKPGLFARVRIVVDRRENRSEERRVGEERGSTGRFRWARSQ